MSTGVQKLHTSPTPRIGGIAIFLTLCALLVYIQITSPKISKTFINIFLSALPIFTAGIFEDLSHKASPRLRLISSIISSVLFMYIFNFQITKTDVLVIDTWLQNTAFSFAVTILVVAGFTHAFNIIDGLNGLASGQAVLIACFLGLVCFKTQQIDLFLGCALLAGPTLGVFVFNFPKGHIFLGDAGAYLLGFVLVCCGLLMADRATEVSPFTPILFGIHPLFEASFSIIRRFLSRQHSINSPDNLHLHSLIYKFAKQKFQGSSLSIAYKNNALSSTFILLLCLFVDTLVVIFYNNKIFLFIIFYCFCSVFVILYYSLMLSILKLTKKVNI